MMRPFALTACALGAFVLLACGDKKPSPKPRVYLALLGKKSNAVIAHFETTCPGRLNRSESGTILACHLPGNVRYALEFDDEHHRIRELEIESTLADAIRIYDRAFAPIVPDETREILHRSLRESKGVIVFRKSGGEVAMSIDVERARDGDPVRIAWTIQDLAIELPSVPSGLPALISSRS